MFTDRSKILLGVQALLLRWSDVFSSLSWPRLTPLVQKPAQWPRTASVPFKLFPWFLASLVSFLLSQTGSLSFSSIFFLKQSQTYRKVERVVKKISFFRNRLRASREAYVPSPLNPSACALPSKATPGLCRDRLWLPMHGPPPGGALLSLLGWWPPNQATLRYLLNQRNPLDWTSLFPGAEGTLGFQPVLTTMSSPCHQRSHSKVARVLMHSNTAYRIVLPLLLLACFEWGPRGWLLSLTCCVNASLGHSFLLGEARTLDEMISRDLFMIDPMPLQTGHPAPLPNSPRGLAPWTQVVPRPRAQLLSVYSAPTQLQPSMLRRQELFVVQKSSCSIIQAWTQRGKES